MVERVVTPKVTTPPAVAKTKVTTSGYSWSRDMWLEKNSNGFWRWRWYKLDDGNNRITTITKGGNTSYKRGSLYVGKLEES